MKNTDWQSEQHSRTQNELFPIARIWKIESTFIFSFYLLKSQFQRKVSITDPFTYCLSNRKSACVSEISFRNYCIPLFNPQMSWPFH